VVDLSGWSQYFKVPFGDMKQSIWSQKGLLAFKIPVPLLSKDYGS